MKKNSVDKITKIRFVGRGSYEYVKNHKTNDLIWTIDGNTYWLLDTEGAHSESSFSSYDDLINYCIKKYKKFRILT